MSDSDSLPDLVESSDDDIDQEQPQKGLVCADTWLNKGEKYLEKQELWMRVFSLGPFLFWFNILSEAWNKALFNAELLLKERKDHKTAYVEWKEWECIDLVDHVVTEVQSYLRNRNRLAKNIEYAGKLDECKDGVVIDVDLAIDMAEENMDVSDLWRTILKHESSDGREKAAKFAVLYVIRIYREHVLCEKSIDFIEHMKKCHRKSIKAEEKAEEFKKIGNEWFKKESFERAVHYYSKAALEDPFNHVYYGNRAQAFLSLKRFRDALADGRRAVTIKPDFPKGHYRYAVAFHSVGQLDSAIRVNEKGLELCQKSSSKDQQNIKELELQGQTFYQERRDKKSVLTPVPKDLDDKLASIPSPNTDIAEKLGCKVPELRKIDEISRRGSSDTESDNVSTDHKKVRRKKKKSKTSMVNTTSKTEKSEDMVTPKQKQGEIQNKSNVKSEEQLLKEEFMMYLTDGSDSYMKHAYKKAMTSYQKALEMLVVDGSQQLFGMDDSDVITLKYAFSIAAIGTSSYKNIQDGIEKLEEIKEYCESHYDIKFPVLYYGLGKAYVSLNRFPEALDPLQDGYQVASSVIYPQVTWPGTKQLIKETDPNVLQDSLKALLQQCRFPPPPDAVCRYHTDTTDQRTVIYHTDPDFKGYTKIICQMDCVITFHQVCFKAYKTKLNKQGDKDVLDTLCPTPDCIGLIIKIHVVRSDSLIKEYLSEKYAELKENIKNKKHIAKQKASNETKIVKKQEKKEKRKQKKRENVSHDLSDNNKQNNNDFNEVITDGASAMAFVADIENEEQVLPDVRDTTVLKKDVIDVQRPGKSRKSKKKSKDKSKQILNVEVNFTDRREETLLNENSVLSDEEKENIRKVDGSENPFIVPAQLKSQIQNFEQTYTAPPKPVVLTKPDEVTENLFSYFVGILKTHGPLAIDDLRVQQELEVFPSEALEKIKTVGGLGDFLRQSFKFAVIDDVISLMSDAKRAREIALIRRQERQNSRTEPPVHNAWKTVGKGVNNVDSLSESIKTAVTLPPASVTLPPTGLTSSTFSAIVCVCSQSLTSQSVSVQSSSSFPNANNSNNVSPFADLSSVSHIQPSMHWSEGVSTFDIKAPIKPPSIKPASDTLDSIDDLPLKDTSNQNTKRDLDDIDDLDALSESGSEIPESQESGSFIKNGFKTDPRLTGLDRQVDSTSRSSSKSDISDSYRSDFSSDLVPKQVKSTSSGSAFGSIGQQKGIWDKLENSSDTAWNKVSKEEYSGLDKESVSREMVRLGDEFVRKSDETFVAELAESVVDKLFEGKNVSEIEKKETLKKVSADIWKDFEKSANAGKKGSSSLWANTPAGADYSKNMGKFATDFMKRHYDNSGRGSVSPTSDLNTLHSQKPLPLPDSFSSFSNNSGFNSSLAWPNSKITTDMQGQSSVSTTSSGYNLFSGPTWGFDSLNHSSSSSSAPLVVRPQTSMPMPPSPFIRPPMTVSSYYQTPQMPVHFRQPPPRLPMPPPMGMPFLPQFRYVRKDEEIQVNVEVTTTGTMTEGYEPLMNEFLQLKDSKNEALRVVEESKKLYEKLAIDHKAKEQQVLVLEADINNKVGMFDLEKRSWRSERDAYREEISRLKEQLLARDSQEREFKEKMIGQEKKVNELALLAKDQREKDLLEINKWMENSEKYRRLNDSLLLRAISSETEILTSKLQTAKSVLERTLKEATFHQQRLSNFVKKHEDESKPVPPALQQAVDFWATMTKTSEENLNKVKTEYEEQIAKVRAGTPLADLEQIVIPSPAVVPESIRSLPFMNPGMQGFMMSRMQFSNRHPFSNQAITNAPSPLGITASALGAAGSLQKALDSNPLTSQSHPLTSQSLVQTSMVSGSSTFNTTASQSMLTAPRPLVPLSAGSSRLDDLAPRAPLSVPNRTPLRPIGIGGMAAPMTSFEKLILKLKMTFPEKSRTEITQLIHGLRQKRGGSLSGMRLEDIVQQIADLITAQEQQGNMESMDAINMQQNMTVGSKPSGPPPGLNTSWAFKAAGLKEGSGKGSGSELYREEEEDPCVICHEEMNPNSVVTLECGHLFHDECIRKWFQEQSTCPNCRVHTLLCDEYPSLG